MASAGTELVEMVVVDGFRYKPDEVPKGKKGKAVPDQVAKKAARNATSVVAGDYGDQFNAKPQRGR